MHSPSQYKVGVLVTSTPHILHKILQDITTRWCWFFDVFNLLWIQLVTRIIMTFSVTSQGLSSLLIMIFKVEVGFSLDCGHLFWLHHYWCWVLNIRIISNNMKALCLNLHFIVLLTANTFSRLLWRHNVFFIPFIAYMHKMKRDKINMDPLMCFVIKKYIHGTVYQSNKRVLNMLIWHFLFLSVWMDTETMTTGHFSQINAPIVTL